MLKPKQQQQTSSPETAVAAMLPTVVRIHPTAVLSIINNHMRRSDRNQRVIGTLLGNVKNNIVEVYIHIY
jgi:rhamnose utilization protein RhaD (predicted bifunctional aldolase and dehydrogenase)